MEKALVSIATEKWYGRISDIAPHKLDPGAAVIQENFRCQVGGQMDVRSGYVTANVTCGSTSLSIINVVAYPYPWGTDYLILQDSNGGITAVNPS